MNEAKRNLLFGALACPACGGSLSPAGHSLVCENRHCFDLSKEGYVNLAPARQSGGGDDAGLIAARTAFLSAGHYEPIAALCETLLHEYAPGALTVDAGCGEGYYSNLLARNRPVLGLDLSKRGVRHAAREAGTAGLSALFAVAGIFRMPVKTGAAGAAVSLFAPICEAEFCRVLAPGGVLLTVGAGPEHLSELKAVLYTVSALNTRRADLPLHMEKLREERLSFRMELPHEDLNALFAMTPYFYKTGREGAQKLAALPGLPVTADVSVAVFRRAGGTADGLPENF